MRTFIAIPLSQEIREILERLQSHLRTSQADVRWAHLEQSHVTLAFWEGIDPSQVSQAIEKVTEVVSEISPFHIFVRGLGAFPSWTRPRVVWTGLQGGEALVQLYEGVLDSLEKIGFPREEHLLKPHCTLGRVKSPKNQLKLVNLARALEKEEYGSFTVDHLIFYESQLRIHGPLHKEIHRFFLKTTQH
ncbi:MAG: RNA 2',3'-cyclic phosphodiesterase [Deltaproteobacteria bacterium]|nr:RNA 2',3'-cyclic phosphodiesterase [Deltaproteobacteria bacterium]